MQGNESRKKTFEVRRVQEFNGYGFSSVGLRLIAKTFRIYENTSNTNPKADLMFQNSTNFNKIVSNS